MAKQRGFLKVEGTYGDVSFFKRKDEFFLRQKGGVSGERILNDPRFRRTRENGTEFGMVARNGKLLRNAVAVLTKSAYDPDLNNRLTQAFTAVKHADVTSVRGQRQIYEGLATEEGLAAMRGFEFNGRSSLPAILAAPYVLNTATGKVTIAGLIPQKMITAPRYATHVTFRSAVLDINFQTQTHSITYSPEVNVPLDLNATAVNLTPSAMPVTTGMTFFLLLVEFFQEQNGVQYALSNGQFNSLTLLDLV